VSATKPQSPLVVDALERTHSRRLTREFVRNEGQFSESREAEARQAVAPAGATDFFADSELQAQARFSPHSRDQAAARRELAARRAKAHATAARNSDTAKRNAPHHVKLARIEAHLRQFSSEQLDAIEGTAWYRGLAPYGRGLVDEALEKIQLEEFQNDPVMAEARLERYGSEPTAEQEPAFRFESADAEATLALEQWLDDDDSGFIDEPGAERSLGQVFDDEYAAALTEYDTGEESYE
jgi:hypothetical protein